MLACKTEAGFSKEYESQAIIENMSNPIMAECTKICYNNTCVHVHGCHELTNELTNYDARNIGCAWSHCNSDIKTWHSYPIILFVYTVLCLLTWRKVCMV